MSNLKGRVALVTGAARGIGLATARALGRAGATVMLTDILDTDGQNAVAALEGEDIKARYLHHDVTDEAAWKDIVAATEKAFGGLDILVNNAGIFFAKPMGETTIEEFRRMQAINVDGVFLGMKTVAPAIAKRAGKWQGGGAIVNLSSVAGLAGTALAVPYNASKGAVRIMTKGAALELAAQKIRVNSIHPGVIETKMGQQVIDDMAAVGVMGGANEVRENLVTMHPIGRFGVPADIANGIVFLSSDEAAFITGTELVVDGGMTAR